VSQQYIDSAFRVRAPVPAAFNWNVADVTVAAPAAWSVGGTLIDRLPIQPPLGDIWSVLSWSIRISPILFVSTLSPAFGKLGRIVGGVLHAAPTAFSTVQPWANPQQPLPNNSAGMTTMWDGVIDPLFVVGSASYPDLVAQPLVTNFQLPVPIDLYPGDELHIGLWITPSLAQNIQIAITNAAYSVIYEDNHQRAGVWGS
jgi:hypothetical protein